MKQPLELYAESLTESQKQWILSHRKEIIEKMCKSTLERQEGDAGEKGREQAC